MCRAHASSLAPQGTACGGLYSNAMKLAIQLAPATLPLKVMAVGLFDEGSQARTSLEGWVGIAGYDASVIDYKRTAEEVRASSAKRAMRDTCPT